MGTHRHPNASVAGIWSITSLKGKVLAPRGSRSGQIFDIFEILGGAGDIYNSISMPNYCDGSHIHVGVYTIKDTSALTDVLVSPWPSRASIMPPGGRCLGDF